jgi:S-DNA-T family DNA segregation ATPase FtsK/SpoIIIE
MLRLDDDSTARAAGFRGPLVSGEHPGRLRVGSCGLEAQIAVGAAGLAALPSRPHPTGPTELIVLPTDVDFCVLTPSHVESDTGRRVRHLVVALASDGLASTPLCVPDGDHIFVGGAARTGVTTALDHVAAAWAACEPDGLVCRWGGSASEARSRLVDDRTRATLLVVDDADRVHDADGLFAEIVRGDHPHVTIAAGARLDAVRSAYGHWTRDVARSRCGFVLTGPGEIDGDLLGVVLPRRTAIAHRPGLAWLIDGRGHRLVQVAGRMPT